MTAAGQTWSGTHLRGWLSDSWCESRSTSSRPSRLRTIAADDLWLSGAYGRDLFAIHFTWRNHLRQVRELLPDIEVALPPFGARPHWGKVHMMDAARIAHVTREVARARDLFERFDPHGKFINSHRVRTGVR